MKEAVSQHHGCGAVPAGIELESSTEHSTTFTPRDSFSTSVSSDYSPASLSSSLSETPSVAGGANESTDDDIELGDADLNKGPTDSDSTAEAPAMDACAAPEEGEHQKTSRSHDNPSTPNSLISSAVSNSVISSAMSQYADDRHFLLPRAAAKLRASLSSPGKLRTHECEWRGRFQNPINKQWLEMSMPIVTRVGCELLGRGTDRVGFFTVWGFVQGEQVRLTKTYVQNEEQQQDLPSVVYEGKLKNGKVIGTFHLAKAQGDVTGIFEIDVGMQSVLESPQRANGRTNSTFSPTGSAYAQFVAEPLCAKDLSMQSDPSASNMVEQNGKSGDSDLFSEILGRVSAHAGGLLEAVSNPTGLLGNAQLVASSIMPDTSPTPQLPTRKPSIPSILRASASQEEQMSEMIDEGASQRQGSLGMEELQCVTETTHGDCTFRLKLPGDSISSSSRSSGSHISQICHADRTVIKRCNVVILCHHPLVAWYERMLSERAGRCAVELFRNRHNQNLLATCLHLWRWFSHWTSIMAKAAVKVENLRSARICHRAFAHSKEYMQKSRYLRWLSHVAEYYSRCKAQSRTFRHLAAWRLTACQKTLERERAAFSHLTDSNNCQHRDMISWMRERGYKVFCSSIESLQRKGLFKAFFIAWNFLVVHAQDIRHIVSSRESKTLFQLTRKYKNIWIMWMSEQKYTRKLVQRFLTQRSRKVIVQAVALLYRHTILKQVIRTCQKRNMMRVMDRIFAEIRGYRMRHMFVRNVLYAHQKRSTRRVLMKSISIMQRNVTRHRTTRHLYSLCHNSQFSRLTFILRRVITIWNQDRANKRYRQKLQERFCKRVLKMTVHALKHGVALGKVARRRASICKTVQLLKETSVCRGALSIWRRDCKLNKRLSRQLGQHAYARFCRIERLHFRRWVEWWDHYRREHRLMGMLSQRRAYVQMMAAFVRIREHMRRLTEAWNMQARHRNQLIDDTFEVWRASTCSASVQRTRDAKLDGFNDTMAKNAIFARNLANIQHTSRVLRRFLSAWAIVWCDIRRQQMKEARFQRLENRMILRRLRYSAKRTFEIWLCSAAISSTRLSWIQKSFQRLHFRIENAYTTWALRKWSKFSQGERGMRQACTRLLQMKDRSVLARAILAWFVKWGCRKRIRSVASRQKKLHCMLHLTKMLDIWRQMVTKSTIGRKVDGQVVRCLHKAQQGLQHVIFRAWESVHVRKKLWKRTCSFVVIIIIRNNKRLLQKFLSTWMDWSAYISSVRLQFNALRSKTCRQHSRRMAAISFEAWKDFLVSKNRSIEACLGLAAGVNSCSTLCITEGATRFSKSLDFERKRMKFLQWRVSLEGSLRHKCLRKCYRIFSKARNSNKQRAIIGDWSLYYRCKSTRSRICARKLLARDRRDLRFALLCWKSCQALRRCGQGPFEQFSSSLFTICQRMPPALALSQKLMSLTQVTQSKLLSKFPLWCRNFAHVQGAFGVWKEYLIEAKVRKMKHRQLERWDRSIHRLVHGLTMRWHKSIVSQTFREWMHMYQVQGDILKHAMARANKIYINLLGCWRLWTLKVRRLRLSYTSIEVKFQKAARGKDQQYLLQMLYLAKWQGSVSRILTHQRQMELQEDFANFILVSSFFRHWIALGQCNSIIASRLNSRQKAVDILLRSSQKVMEYRMFGMILRKWKIYIRFAEDCARNWALLAGCVLSSAIFEATGQLGTFTQETYDLNRSLDDASARVMYLAFRPMRGKAFVVSEILDIGEMLNRTRSRIDFIESKLRILIQGQMYS